MILSINITVLPGHRKVLTAPHPNFRQKLPPKVRKSKVRSFFSMSVCLFVQEESPFVSLLSARAAPLVKKRQYLAQCEKRGTASKRVLILRTWSLMRTFLAFWVLIFTTLVSFTQRMSIQSACIHICRHRFRLTLLANFDFDLCLHINF